MGDVLPALTRPSPRSHRPLVSPHQLFLSGTRVHSSRWCSSTSRMMAETLVRPPSLRRRAVATSRRSSHNCSGRLMLLVTYLILSSPAPVWPAEDAVGCGLG